MDLQQWLLDRRKFESPETQGWDADGAGLMLKCDDPLPPRPAHRESPGIWALLGL